MCFLPLFFAENVYNVKTVPNCISIDFAEYNVDGGKEDLFDVNEGKVSMSSLGL